MGLGSKTSSVLVTSCGRGAASAARGSTTTHSLARTRTCGRPGQGPPPGILYIDRGVIVLNKPPGLVSQGTSSIAPVAAAKRPSHLQNTTTQTLPARTAFDDVLDGTVFTNSLFFYLFLELSMSSALTRRGSRPLCLFLTIHFIFQVSDGLMTLIQIHIRSID